jgi:hypothetical protein
MTEKPVRTSVSELGSVAAALVEETEALVNDLRALDARLRTMKLEVPAEGTRAFDRETFDRITGDDGDRELVTLERRLAYALCEGHWAIVVRHYRTDDPETEPLTASSEDPLLACNREIQIKAVETGAVDDLLDVLNREAEKRLTVLRSGRERRQRWNGGGESPRDGDPF